MILGICYTLNMIKVPFFANTKDDTHCVQACFKMVLKFYFPDKDFSFEELDAMSYKVPGKGTWWFPALKQLEAMGVKCKIIELFDYQRYFKEGADYLVEFYGPQIATSILKTTNLEEVKHLIPALFPGVAYENRTAGISDIDELLSDGWLVAPEISSSVINNHVGTTAHMVIVFANDGSNYTFHDPGLPPRAGRVESKKLFQIAMQYAGENNTALLAFRPTKPVK